MKKMGAWLKGLGLVVIGALLIINVAAAQSSDTTPPTGSILINGGAAYATSSSVTLTLSTTDTGSGVSQMQFSNDNVNWTTPETYTTTKVWTLSAGGGNKTVYVKFKDVAGNWSGSYYDAIGLDTAAPTGSVTINSGAASTTSTSVTLYLSATDAVSFVSRMQFSNDNVTWTTPERYTTSKAWTLTSGVETKTVYVKFKDVAGNWSSSYSDTIILTGAPNAPTGLTATAASSSQINLAWVDNATNETNYYVERSTDNANFTQIATLGADVKSYSATGLSASTTYYFRVRAYNGAYSGYATANATTLAFSDTTPPTGSILINGGATYTTSANATLTLSASDASGVSQMQFSNDNVNWSTAETYTTSKAWILTAGTGTKTVYVKFKDVAGNWSGSYYDTITTPQPVETESVYITTPDCYPSFTSKDSGQIEIIARDYANIDSPGDPALPFKELSVIVPPNVELNDIKISLEPLTDHSFRIPFEITPAAPFSTIDGEDDELYWGSNKTIVGGKNTAVYNNNAFYPASHVEIARIGDMRKWRIAQIRFYPYLYNPGAQLLCYARKGRIRIEFPDGSVQKSTTARATPLTNDNTFDDLVREMTVNYNEAKAWYPEQRAIAQAMEVRALDECPGGKCDFMIVTTKAIKEASAVMLEAFAQHKRDYGGFNVCIVTEKTWGGGTGDGLTWTYPGGDNYPGHSFWDASYLADGSYKLHGDPKAPFPKVANPAPEKLRAFLQKNYLSLGIKYVLLIGNPDPRKGDVPMKRLEANFTEVLNADGTIKKYDYKGDAPTDYYYADLGNRNGQDSMDWFPELFVGRIPYYGKPDEPEHLEHILQKIINYETGVQSDFDQTWMKRVLLTMIALNSETLAYQLGENIMQDLANSKSGFQAIRIYDRENIPKAASMNGAPAPLAIEDNPVIPTWQKNVGFHFWYTHGRPAMAKGGVLSLSSVPYLDDSHPSFVFHASCMNGLPEVANNLGYALLYNGAIATVSASRVGMMIIGETDFHHSGSAGGIAYGYATRLLKKNQPCGEAWAMANNERRGYGALFMNNMVFNLYGDPSVSPRTGVGFSLRHTPLTNVEDGSGPYTVKVSLNHGRGYRDARLTLLWAINTDTKFQAVPMNSSGDGKFYAEIRPQNTLSAGTTVKYYILALDAQSNELKSPFEAPNTVYSFQVNPDRAAPTIKVISENLTWGPGATVIAQITDASGADAQLVYKIDTGADKPPLAMQNKGSNIYEAALPDPQAGQTTISYRIVATDRSAAKHIGYYPTKTTYKQLKISTTPAAAPTISVTRDTMNRIDQVTVSWTTKGEIIEYQYRLMRNAPNGPEFKSWTSTEKGSLIRIPLTDLTAGTAYYVAVKARNDSGLWSAEGTAQITSVITAPVAISAVLEKDPRITITWKRSPEAVTGYKIERKIADGPWSEAGSVTLATLTTWRDIVNVTGVTYSYRIYAYKLGNSPYSNTVTVAVPPTLLKPGTPPGVESMLVVAKKRFTNIKFADTALNTNNVFDALLARGWLTPVSSAEACVGKDPVKMAAELKTLFPKDYSKVSAVLQSPQVRISWMKRVGEAVSLVRIYRGRYAGDSLEIQKIPTDKTWCWSYLDESNDLAADTYYVYGVKFENKAGLSDSTTTVIKTPPAKNFADTTPPINLRIEVKSSTWNSHVLDAFLDADDQESDVTGFDYRIKEGNAEGLTVIVDWTHVDKSPGAGVQVIRTGLTLRKGMTYFFEVRAINGAGLTTTLCSRGITAR